MKKLQFSIVMFMLVAFVCTVNAGLTTPYSLSGHVYDSDGTTGIVGANITFTNQNSSEVIYATSTVNGEYQQDAANFLSGYFDGDTILYYTTYNTQTNTTTAKINVSGGGTPLDIVLSSAPSTATTATGTAIDRLANIFLLVFLLFIALLFLFYSWLAPEKYNYTDIVAAFISSLLFFIVAYYNLSLLKYGWLSLFMVMLALVQIMFMVLKIIDVFQRITARL